MILVVFVNLFIWGTFSVGSLVTTAGARELACFVWGMMNFVDNRKTALNKIDEGELSDIQKTVGEFIA